jgi:predicted NAD-dependent protein-ADP-ribosyltransferase YbiA (DUF1768 family)
VNDENSAGSPQLPVIEFDSAREACGAFSNFASYPFSLDGWRWRTAEQYFQAQKCAGAARAEAIRQTP